MHRQFIEEETRTAYKHRKRWSISLQSWKWKLEPQQNIISHPPYQQKFYNLTISPPGLHIADWMKIDLTSEEHFGTPWKACSSQVPTVLLPGINPRENLSKLHQETSAKMSMAPLFVKARTDNNLNAYEQNR